MRQTSLLLVLVVMFITTTADADLAARQVPTKLTLDAALTAVRDDLLTPLKLKNPKDDAIRVVFCYKGCTYYCSEERTNCLNSPGGTPEYCEQVFIECMCDNQCCPNDPCP